jgi:hypothetical protein
MKFNVHMENLGLGHTLPNYLFRGRTNEFI